MFWPALAAVAAHAGQLLSPRSLALPSLIIGLPNALRPAAQPYKRLFLAHPFRAHNTRDWRPLAGARDAARHGRRCVARSRGVQGVTGAHMCCTCAARKAARAGCGLPWLVCMPRLQPPCARGGRGSCGGRAAASRAAGGERQGQAGCAQAVRPMPSAPDGWQDRKKLGIAIFLEAAFSVGGSRELAPGQTCGASLGLACR